MKALLVIDMQNGLVELNPWNIERVITNIKALIEKARQQDVEVIYVSHTTDSELFLEGSHNWQITSELKPLQGEKVFLKAFSSSFKGTGLHDYLTNKGINELIITGMQTEKCADTAIRVAFDLGYKVIVPEYTNTTFDSKYIRAETLYLNHNFEIFNGRFATVVKHEQAIDSLGE